MPGDDNFHNPLTNIDFRVTPPVRKYYSRSQCEDDAELPSIIGRASITLTPQPEIQFESYFEVPKSNEPSGLTTPTQSLMKSSRLGAVDDSQRSVETRPQDTVTSEMNHKNPVSTGVSLGATPTSLQPSQRQPKNFSELFGEKEQRLSPISSSPAAEDNTSSHEEAFGTNLTTGRREYLSQYPQAQGSTENVDDGQRSFASRITQDDTFSTDSSLSADLTGISDLSSGEESLTVEDIDVY